jgi:hypothetical protein
MRRYSFVRTLHMFPDGFNMVCIRSLSFQNQRHRCLSENLSRGHVQLTATDDSGLIYDVQRWKYR